MTNPIGSAPQLRPATAGAVPNDDAYTQIALAPVRPDERISALDSIRGFALLGILLMNIAAFTLPYAAYENPIPAGGATGKNLIAYAYAMCGLILYPLLLPIFPRPQIAARLHPDRR